MSSEFLPFSKNRAAPACSSFCGSGEDSIGGLTDLTGGRFGCLWGIYTEKCLDEFFGVGVLV